MKKQQPSTVAIKIIATGIVMALLVACSYVTSGIPCHSKADKMGFEADYGFVTGCMIKVRDKWVPIERYRVEE